jgi:hypothetical protein
MGKDIIVASYIFIYFRCDLTLNLGKICYDIHLDLGYI